MAKFIELSYKLDSNAPLYPGTPALKVKRLKAIKNGDSCNTFFVGFSNHSGTHIDAPAHFFVNGRKIGDYIFAELIFKNPLIVDLSKRKDEPIEIKDFKKIENHMKRKIDALLIRTGFSRLRKNDPESYSKHNPYFLPHTAEWLKDNFKSLKVLALDFISAGNTNKKEIGRKVHRIMLGEKGITRRPLLIVEDLRIPSGLKKLNSLIIIPFLGAAADSSPCAAIGVIND